MLEVQDWLHSWDSNIDIAPSEATRNDTRFGQVWDGREKKDGINIVCYNCLKKEFRIELWLANRDLARQMEKDLRDAGLDSWYTTNKRLNIPLTAATFERHKPFLKRLVHATYDQAI